MKRLPPRIELGLRIKELRAARGMTQDDLAEKTGFFRTYLSRVETGVANPTFDALLALADALRVAPAALFEAPTSPIPVRTRAARGGSRGRAGG